MMPSLRKRAGIGRRAVATDNDLAMRGLLHDLGHEVATLSYLIETVRADPGIPEESAVRLELLALETSRLLEIIGDGLGQGRPGESVSAVDLRALTAEVARLAGIGHEATVVAAPGPAVWMRANPARLWRILSNLADNAARAAGPGGRVRIAVRSSGAGSPGSASVAESADRGAVVIEVIDDGPGFGGGPPGTASLGLRVVTSLLEETGGTAEVDTPPGGGTRVRVRLRRDLATELADTAPGALRAAAGYGG